MTVGRAVLGTAIVKCERSVSARKPSGRSRRCIGDRKAATTAQVALAWLLAQKPWIVPIHDATKLGRLKENLGAADVELTAADLADIERAAGAIAVGGEHYPPALLATNRPANV